MKVDMLINNQDVSTEAYLDVYDPGKLTELIGYLAKGNPEYVDQAVQAAHQAFLSWRTYSLDKRLSLMLKAIETIEQEISSIAKLTSKENGILLGTSEAELKVSLLEMKILIELAPAALEVTYKEDETGWVRVEKKPLGVVGCIVPWNAPLLLTLQKITPILIAGNTVVLKPSPTASMGVTALLKLMAATFPPGVINVVLGDGDVGSALTSHPLVRKISFTGGGSTAVMVMKSAADTLKQVHFELGGNDPAIVLPDADIAQIVPQMVEGAFKRTGQYCFAIKRIYIPEHMYDDFYEQFCKQVDHYKIGHQLNEQATMGPMNNRLQYQRVKDLIARLEHDGANLVRLGTKLEPDNWDNGYYLQPTVVRDVAPDSEIVTCEQFGPVLPLVSYKTEAEVIQWANATEYGLGSSVWSSDPEHALEVANQIEAGMTFINGNGPNLLASKYMPFGGVKQSGIGREKSLEVFNEFTNYHGINFHR